MGQFPRFLMAILFAIALTGCGGGGGKGAGTETAQIGISPGEFTVGLSAKQNLAAYFTSGSGEVTWTVVESGGGTISTGGQYTAPNTVGTYHVRASVVGRTATATATVRVTDGAYVIVQPVLSSVEADGNVTFTGTVVGGTGTIAYSVVEPTGGTITTDGVYTAPPTAGTYHVLAQLPDRPNSKVTLAVTVNPAIAVTIPGPTYGSLLAIKSKLTFSASVANATVNTVTWSADGGTISTTGEYTAPTAPGTYTITAASTENPRRTAQRAVEVVANPAVRLKIDGKDDLVLRLDTDHAPNTSANLVTLANQGFYDGIIFHRYEPDFIVQGGDPQTKTLPLDDPAIGGGGPGYTIAFETNSLKHVKYALAMARKSGINSAGSQFYLCLKDLPDLDTQYVVFGQTESGFATVDALRKGDKIISMRVEK